MEMEQKWGMGIGGGYSLLCVIIVSFTLESPFPRYAYLDVPLLLLLLRTAWTTTATDVTEYGVHGILSYYCNLLLVSLGAIRIESSGPVGQVRTNEIIESNLNLPVHWAVRLIHFTTLLLRSMQHVREEATYVGIPGSVLRSPGPSN